MSVADAIVRAFIDTGDRTDRNRARLKYVLDAIGIDAFLALVEEKLASPLTRVPSEAILLRPPIDRLAHVGVHPQKQDGRNWIGVALDAGRLSEAQMQGVAAIAAELGDGDIRLTVWQNFLISGVALSDVDLALARLDEPGHGWPCGVIKIAEFWDFLTVDGRRWMGLERANGAGDGP